MQGHFNDILEPISEETKMEIKSCVVAVICITREYKANQGCQKIARYIVAQERRVITLFALLQGDYSETSIPERITGWLGHMIRDAVTYPCYSELQISATSAMIDGVFTLRKKQIIVHEKEVDKFAARNDVVKKRIERIRTQRELMLENEPQTSMAISSPKKMLPSPGPSPKKILL